MAEPIITNINPIKFSYQEISNNDTSLIKNFDIYSNFGNPNTYSEFHIYNNEILIFSDLNYTHYSVINEFNIIH